jgi:hypothetical protein
VWADTSLLIYVLCERAYTGVIDCVFDQIPNLQHCFTTPNKNLGGEGPKTDKHLPPNPLTDKFLRKDDF